MDAQSSSHQELRVIPPADSTITVKIDPPSYYRTRPRQNDTFRSKGDDSQLNITEMTVPETLEETDAKSRVVTFRQEARPQTSIPGVR